MKQHHIEMIPRSILEAAEKAAQANPTAFIKGVGWLFTHLTEMAGREFDEVHYIEYFKTTLSVANQTAFINGARHQHALDQALIMRLREQLKQPIAYRPPTEDEQRAFIKRFIENLRKELAQAREEIAGMRHSSVTVSTELMNQLHAERAKVAELEKQITKLHMNYGTGEMRMEHTVAPLGDGWENDECWKESVDDGEIA